MSGSMHARALLLAFVIGCGGAKASAFDLQGRLYIEGFTGKAIVPFLGSEDPRSTYGLGLGYVLGGIRSMRVGSYKPETIIQVYYQRSTTPGVSGIPRNGTDAFGVLALTRYTSRRHDGLGLYVDLGIGFQYADMRTVDLSGRGSFTPVLGLGLSMRHGGAEWTLGARLFHISNAALQGNNQGQNQLMLTFGVRF